MTDRYARVGLRIDRIGHGSWCGRGAFLSYQDLVLARKVQRESETLTVAPLFGTPSSE